MQVKLLRASWQPMPRQLAPDICEYLVNDRLKIQLPKKKFFLYAH